MNNPGSSAVRDPQTGLILCTMPVIPQVSSSMRRVSSPSPSSLSLCNLPRRLTHGNHGNHSNEVSTVKTRLFSVDHILHSYHLASALPQPCPQDYYIISRKTTLKLKDLLDLKFFENYVNRKQVLCLLKVLQVPISVCQRAQPRSQHSLAYNKQTLTKLKQ